MLTVETPAGTVKRLAATTPLEHCATNDAEDADAAPGDAPRQATVRTAAAPACLAALRNTRPGDAKDALPSTAQW
jgi:hypothetical protein